MSYFFFKQKTAYEVRISDWSSDVCSSDLTRRNARRERGLGDDIGVEHRAGRRFDHQGAAGRHRRGDLVERQCNGKIPGDDRRDDAERRAFDERLLAHLRRPHIGSAHRARKPGIILQRSEEHTSELQSLMRISYAVFCLKKKKNITI